MIQTEDLEGADESLIDGFINYARSISGVEVATQLLVPKRIGEFLSGQKGRLMSQRLRKFSAVAVIEMPPVAQLLENTWLSKNVFLRLFIRIKRERMK